MTIDQIINACESLRTVICFLYENEQYGDDWSEEIEDLNLILEILQREDDAP